MTTKFRSFLKQQLSHKLGVNSEKAIECTETMQRTRETQKTEKSILRHSEHRKQRSKTDLGSTETMLRCTICMDKLISPKMLPCQHTFCLQCLKKQTTISDNKDISIVCGVCRLKVTKSVPENISTNLYIGAMLEMVENFQENKGIDKVSVLQFTTLPGKAHNQNDEASKCHVCETRCGKENKCEHCKHVFCQKCWSTHMKKLNDEFGNLWEELENAVKRFECKIDDLHNKVEDTRHSVNKDIQEKIDGLLQLRDKRLKKLNGMSLAKQKSCEEVKEKIQRVLDEIQTEKCDMCDCLPDDQEKINVFLSIQQKTSELITAVSTWDPEILNGGGGFNDNKQRNEMEKMREHPLTLYNRKAIEPKIIATRDVVQRPTGLALDPLKDHVIVACPGSGQVVVLDRKLKVLRRIHHQDMMAPQGVAFLEETEEIFVTDKWKHCIFVFNRKGELQRRVCGKGTGNSQLRSPEGMSVHPERSLLYVADTGNDRILILEKDGVHRGTIGTTDKHTQVNDSDGTNQSQIIANQLCQPTDVAVSSTTVVVADRGNHRLKIFDHDGQILRVCGGFGTSRGFFKSPQVVCIDRKGNIIVGDSGNGRLQIYSDKGKFLRTIGDKGYKARQFGWVSGVLVKNNNELLVADNESNVMYLY